MSPEVTMGEMPSSINVPARQRKNSGVQSSFYQPLHHNGEDLKLQISVNVKVINDNRSLLEVSLIHSTPQYLKNTAFT